MKPHTREEKNEAEKKLPRPTFDFLGSPALEKIYSGIASKFKLNLRQMMIVSEITNVTLMGLEPESAVETNLHQWLHELSNEATRELVADINDRVFREAKRRLMEHITEPEEPWDEEVMGPKDIYVRPPTDVELDRMVEEEERMAQARGITVEELEALEQKKREAEKMRLTIAQLEEKEARDDKEAAQRDWTEKPPEEEPEVEEESETPAAGAAGGGDTIATPIGGVHTPSIADEKLSVPSTATQESIALQKLAAPTVAKQEEVSVTPQESGTQGVATQPPENPLTRKYPSENDPYKEPIE